ncbi:Yrb2 protein [Saccharomycopsis crataegensis]|uniref:Yrb2 protein n=1 Tax=Saccharomycopsis crataegensis TaxID=43959 RepID=A0AAV5QUI6_9ASCO|nr:Yrb2 protein [Saccharomycopsis crataegensis]
MSSEHTLESPEINTATDPAYAMGEEAVQQQGETKKEEKQEEKQEKQEASASSLPVKRSLEDVSVAVEAKETDTAEHDTKKPKVAAPVEEDKKTNKTLPTNDDKESQPLAPQKFVFGQNSKFGSTAFSGISGRKNVFGTSSIFSDKKEPTSPLFSNSNSPSIETKTTTKSSSSETPEKSKSTPTTTSTTSTTKSAGGFVFGSGSKFSNAFKNAANKKSIFDTSEAKKEDSPAPPTSSSQDATTTTPSSSSSSSEVDKSSGHLYKTVNLEKKDVKSGEEEETAVFQCKAKLYMLNLDDLSTGWKERGVGMIHVNKLATESSKKVKTRIIMRTLTVLKVILNVSIAPGFEIFKGMDSSLHSEKFIRFNAIETDDNLNTEAKNGLAKNQRLVQYAVRVGNAESATELYDTIKMCIPDKEESKEPEV